MASYTMRRVQVTRREYVVPCYGEDVWDGAMFVEVEKAIAACRQELDSAGVAIGDNTIRIRPDDSSIVVYYVAEENMPDEVVVEARLDAVALRTQLRATEAALVELVGDPGAGLSATTLARLERQLGDIQRALRTSENR